VACRKHLEQEKDAYLRLQARLGIGRLQAKAGDLDAAIRTYDELIASAGTKPVAGVAHFRLGQIYEFQRKDKAKATEHYRYALQAANEKESMVGFVDAILDYHADDGAGGKRVYAIAALTDTMTSANAARAKIVQSLEALTGEKVDATAIGLLPKISKTEEPPEVVDKDPLVIIHGR
jgi:tetratricopeptide (TPR) repeat protein